MPRSRSFSVTPPSAGKSQPHFPPAVPRRTFQTQFLHRGIFHCQRHPMPVRTRRALRFRLPASPCTPLRFLPDSHSPSPPRFYLQATSIGNCFRLLLCAFQCVLFPILFHLPAVLFVSLHIQNLLCRAPSGLQHRAGRYDQYQGHYCRNPSFFHLHPLFSHRYRHIGCKADIRNPLSLRLS